MPTPACYHRHVNGQVQRMYESIWVQGGGEEHMGAGGRGGEEHMGAGGRGGEEHMGAGGGAEHMGAGGRGGAYGCRGEGGGGAFQRCVHITYAMPLLILLPRTLQMHNPSHPLTLPFFLSPSNFSPLLPSLIQQDRIKLQ